MVCNLGCFYIIFHGDIRSFKGTTDSEKFEQLPNTEQQLLKNDYQQLQTYAKRSTLQKIQDGILTLIRDIPPFEQAWMFFSITIALFDFIKSGRGKIGCFDLPLIVLAYTVDNQMTGNSFSLA